MESALPTENAAEKTVSIQCVDNVDNQEVRLHHCYSVQREQKEAAINQHLRQRFEAALHKMIEIDKNNGLSWLATAYQISL